MKCLGFCKGPCSWVPQRYFMAIYGLIGLNIYFWIRVCMNLALTEMTFPTASNKTNNTQDYCPPGDEYGHENKTKAEFAWDQHTQHFIIQGFYYGYLISQVPGGLLADTFGGKSVLGWGFFISAIVSLMMPFLARTGYFAFFLGRVVQGLGQGVVFPSLSAMVAKWTPPNERSRMTGITQSGALFGNASAFIASGFILSATPGWEEVFYIVGALGLVWIFGWYLLCYSTPAQHPFVTEKEKNMIETQIAQNSKKRPKSVPWGSILTSLPLFAGVVANYGHLWANFTMINEMPMYLKKVLHFDIKKIGIFSATPHLSMIPTAIGGGYLCDWLVSKNIMGITFNRKIFIFLSNSLPVPFLIAASLAGCDKIYVVILFTITMFFKGLAYPTLKAQPVDLSPNFAGTLMGILNGTGSLSGIISPKVVPYFLSGDGTLGEWRRFFILSGTIMIASTFPFLCMGSAKVQSWNNINEDEEVGDVEAETVNKDGTVDPPK